MQVGGLKYYLFTIEKPIADRASIFISLIDDNYHNYTLEYYHSDNVCYHLGRTHRDETLEWGRSNYSYKSIRYTFGSCEEYFSNSYIILLNELLAIAKPYWDIWVDSEYDAAKGEEGDELLSQNEAFIESLLMLDQLLDYKIECAYSHVYGNPKYTQDSPEYNGIDHVTLAIRCGKTCECVNYYFNELLEFVRNEAVMCRPGHNIRIQVFKRTVELSPECDEILLTGSESRLTALGREVSRQFFRIFNSAEPVRCKSSRH